MKANKTFQLVMLLSCILLLGLFVNSAKGETSNKRPSPENIASARSMAERGWNIVDTWGGEGEKLNRAEQLFDAALNLDSECGEAHAGLGRIILRRGYISGHNYQKGSLKNALKYTEKGIALDPDFYRAHKLRGWILGLMGEYDEALKEADIVEELDATVCEHIDLRGHVYRLAGEINRAIKEFQKIDSCVNITKRQKAKMYDRLSNFYYSIKDYDNAALYSERAIDLVSDQAWYYGNYAMVLIAKNELDKAEQIANKAIDIMDYGIAHHYLSIIYNRRATISSKQGDTKTAEAHYIRSIDEDPTNMYSYNGLMLIYLKANNCDKAVEVAKTALSVDSNCEIAQKVVAACRVEAATSFAVNTLGSALGRLVAITGIIVLIAAFFLHRRHIKRKRG